MPERQPVSVQRLPRERNRSEMIRPEDVPLLADEHVPAQPRLEANLVAPAGDQLDFDQRRAAESLDDAVLADSFLAARIARARLLLYQRMLIPHEMIAPRAGGWTRVAVHHRTVDARRLVLLELFFQPRLRVGALREDDEARGVAVDAVHERRPPRAAGAEMVLDLLGHRPRLAGPL